MESCSTAAARNVSPAPRTTRSPASVKRRVSFAIEVVFPDPFTPVTRMTVGPDVDLTRSPVVPASLSESVRRIDSTTTSGSTTRARNRSPTSFTIASAAEGPISVRTRAPRSSSRNDVSTCRPSCLSKSRTSVLRTCAVFDRPARRRSKMPGRVESSCSSSLVDESGEDFPNRNNAMVF